jgi:CDP-Glycerol:Poly(glycerophosphate) glycerophosphotransferase
MAAFFQALEARVVVMTMPDLETFHIKRSRSVRHYVYLHHSIVSTHMVYRKAAFDHFDSILCVGPHHVEETREWEAALGLPAKRLVRHGYGLLDDIITTASPLPVNGHQKTILVAPSWGPQGLLETCGLPLCRGLLDTGHRVVVRPHPRSGHFAPRLIPDLQSALGTHPNFVIDRDVEGWNSLAEADVMISDWSGVAFEYAFGLLRPVIFIDTPRKVNNPHYERLRPVPFEVQMRAQIGSIVPCGQWEELRETVSRSISEEAEKRDQLRRQREELIFNVGNSAAAASRYLLELGCWGSMEGKPG